MSSRLDIKRALIIGITGQDGAYLTALLLKKGYEVHGMRRWISSPNSWRLDLILNSLPISYRSRLILHYGDLTDTASIMRIMSLSNPDEIYNLAAQSHVAVSFDVPEYTAQVVAVGATRLLESIRTLGLIDRVRFYQASSSELFGNAAAPQNESTPFSVRSPYAAAKLYAYWITVNYREAYGLFASNGILFNHESPLRDASFVTRKITNTLARIYCGSSEVLVLGNLYARRDWGYAPDYVKAMWLMMQHEVPADFVIATGHMHTVKEFVEKACQFLKISLKWLGTCENEQGINESTGKTIIAVDPYYFRPTEVDHLCGNASKAHAELGWNPTVTFEQLVAIMMEADLDALVNNMPTAQRHVSKFHNDSLVEDIQ